MRDDKIVGYGCIGLLTWLFFWGAIFYVAWHFISKFW